MAEIKKWLRDELGRSRAKNLIRAYAQMMITRGPNLSEEDFKILGALYRPKDRIPEASAKRLLRYDVVKELVAQEIEKIMEEQGITPTSIVQSDKEIRDRAMTLDDLGVANQINRAHTKMLGIDKPSTTFKEQHTYEYQWKALLEEEENQENVPELPENNPALLNERTE